VSVAEAFAQTFPAPEWWRRMDASQRMLCAALVLSTVAHASLLAVKFAAPEEFRLRSRDSPLDVILVNAKHASKPVKAEALAQANLDGGGDAAKGRAQSFLVNSRRSQDGEQLEQAAMRRARELEAEQRKLLSALKGQSKIAAADVRPQVQPEPIPPTPSTVVSDSLIAAREIARQEAEINKRIADENARPKRGHVSPSTREVVEAMYLKQWTDKVERIGNNNYPDQARGGTFRLVMTVSVWPDGRVEKIEIDHPSGSKAVDEAARRIVRLGEPYGRFSPALKAQYGILDLTMAWTFSRADALSVQSRE
jgi:protein TonB